MAEYVNTIVKILNSETSEISLGTGFFISSAGHILTCDHVIRDCGEEVWIKWKGAKKALKASVRSDWRSNAVDFAIIKVEIPDDSPINVFTTNISWECLDAVIIYGFQYDAFEFEAFPAYGKIVGKTERNRVSYLTLENAPNIREGISGAPVYNTRTNSFLGIVTRKGGANDTGIVLPLNEIDKFLSVDIKLPGWLSAALTNSSFQCNYPNVKGDIIRHTLLDRISHALESVSVNTNDKRGTCVLYGNSGYGKSQLAARFYENYDKPKRWFDCRIPFELPANLADDELIVFDNVTEGHPLIDTAENWINKLNGRIIAITNHLSCAKITARQRGRGSKEDLDLLLIEVSGIQEEEGIKFLNSKGLDSLTDDYKRSLIRYTNGSPMAIRAIADIYINNLICEFFEQVGFELNTNDTTTHLENVISEWVELKSRGNPLTKLATSTLAKIPFVGMSFEALAFVLNTKLEDLRGSLQPLIKEKFINQWQFCQTNKNNYSINEELLIVHDFIKKIYKNKEHQLLNDANFESESSQRKRYLNYLRKSTEHGSLESDCQKLTQIDAWISEVHDIFTTELFVKNLGWHYFIKRLKYASNILAKIIPQNLDSKYIQQIVNLFAQNIPDAECSEVIGLAWLMSKLPANLSIGNAIWVGAEHPDGWARGACIRAACMHWHKSTVKLGMQQLQIENLKVLDTWINKFYPKTITDELNIDFDYAAALGGYCLFGKTSTKALYSIKCDMKYRYTVLSDLVVLINLIDEGSRDKVESYLWERWQNICDIPAKQSVIDYARQKVGGIRCPTHLPSVRVEFKVDDLRLTLADVAHSESYREFVYKSNPTEGSLFALPDERAQQVTNINGSIS
jgi:hypothetical protein